MLLPASDVANCADEARATPKRYDPLIQTTCLQTDAMNSTQKLSNINFFISSTYEDMKEYRTAVIKELQSKAGVINAQEFFGARDRKPLDACIEEIEKSDVFVLILGHRYGSIDSGSGKSFVECEYDRAGELKLPRFAYIMDVNHPFPPKFVSTGDDAVRLAAFKARVEKELTMSKFTTPGDLAEKVYSDLSRELPRRDFVLGKELAEDELPSTLKTLKEFHLLPKLYHGRLVSFLTRLGKCERASKYECEAFGYDFGATLKRHVEPVDSSLRQALSTSSWVFASRELAPKLLELAGDKGIRLSAKTVQGEYVVRQPVYDLEREESIFDTVQLALRTRRRVVVDFSKTSELLCGLEFVDSAES